MQVTDKIQITNEDNMLLMARYPDKYFDLAIVDPPYGIGESSNDNKSRSKLGKSKNYGNKNWDDNAPNQDYFNELKRVSKHQVIGVQIILLKIYQTQIVVVGLFGIK